METTYPTFERVLREAHVKAQHSALAFAEDDDDEILLNLPEVLSSAVSPDQILDLVSGSELLALLPVPFAEVIAATGNPQPTPFELLSVGVLRVITRSLLMSIEDGDVSEISDEFEELLYLDRVSPIWRGDRPSINFLFEASEADLSDWYDLYPNAEAEELNEVIERIIASWLPSPQENPGAYVDYALEDERLLDKPFALRASEQISFAMMITLAITEWLHSAMLISWEEWAAARREPFVADDQPSKLRLVP